MAYSKLFDPYSVDDQAIFLASHLPEGRVWSQAFNPESDFGKLMRGLAAEFYRYHILIQNLTQEYDLREANDLLVEWEKSMGIPDSCFSDKVDLEARRKQIEAKWTKYGGIQTADDIKRLALFFGFEVLIAAGSSLGAFPLTFPINFFSDGKAALHTVFLQLVDQPSENVFFPLPFPIPFSSGGTTFLKCILEKLLPANVQLIIKEILP